MVYGWKIMKKRFVSDSRNDQPFLWKRAKGWFFDQDASMMFTKSVNVTGQSEESSAENGRSASLIKGQRKRERSKIRGVTSCSHWKMLEIKANLDLKCVCELHLKWFLIIESIDHWNMRKSHPSIKKINIFTFQPANSLWQLVTEGPGIPSSGVPSARTSGWPAGSASSTTADPGPWDCWTVDRKTQGHMEHGWNMDETN